MSGNSAVSAKVRAMYGKCLTKTDFENLVSNTQISGVYGYLKNQTSYSDVLADMSEGDVHRGMIEWKISSQLDGEFARIYNFVDSKQQVILDYWFKRREVNYLKHNIRNLFNRESKLAHMPDTEEFSEFFQKHTLLNTDLCRTAESIDGFIKACENTMYEEFLKRAAAVNSEYFSIVMGLDALYYEAFWKACAKLPQRERTALERLIGSEIDILNIIWIYRGKKYFKFNDELIYTYLLPVNYRLSGNTIKQMVSAKTTDEMIVVAKNTPYSRLFKKLSEGFYIDENYRRYMYKLAKSVFRTSTDTVAGLIAYLDLKEFEQLNIIRVVEGIRYGVNQDAIRKHIRL